MRGRAHTALQTFCIIDGLQHNKDSLFYKMNFLRGGPKFYQGGRAPGPSPGYASAVAGESTAPLKGEFIRE